MSTDAAQPLRGGGPTPKTIVVGYDGTRQAELALARAAEFAEAFRARIVVADVATAQPVEAMPGAFGLMPYYYYSPEQGVDAPADEDLWRQHRARVESFFAKIGIPYEFAGAVGEPAAEIVDIADQRAAELIVVGTREPGFLARLLGGSVSEGVARQAHCDVLIVRSEDGAADEAGLSADG